MVILKVTIVTVVSACSNVKARLSEKGPWREAKNGLRRSDAV
jgi:hypothetical protein